MAQTGYTPISIYYSATASNTPTAGNLVAGELAINTADGKLFYKDSSGVVQTIASKAGNINVSSFSGGSTGLTPNTATTGVVTLAGTLSSANGGTGQTNITFPSSGGTAMVSGNMPAFSVYQSITQSSASGVATKIQFQTELFDTANAFNNTSSTVGTAPAYTFNPQVAGYYQINAGIAFASPAASVETYILLAKNGSPYQYGMDASPVYSFITAGSWLIYLNGSTDYIEIQAAQYSGISKNTSNAISQTWFSGSMVRSA